MNVSNLSYKLLVLASVLMLFSCGEKEVEYVAYEVSFFKDSPYFIYTRPVWEEISEQYLVKEAHKQGATFTDVTSQVLVRDAWTSKTVATEGSIKLVTDVEFNTAQSINCNDFLQVSELIDVQHPAIYTTLITQEVLVDGTGAEIPGQYRTRTYSKLQSDAKYEPADNTNIISNTFTFRLPSDMSVVDYIQNAFRDSIQFDCIESVGFSIQ